jgi:hypothetical protein
VNSVVITITTIYKRAHISRIYESCLKSSWTGGSAPLLCCYASFCITAAHRRQSTYFSNGPRSCSVILKRILLKDRDSNDGQRDEDHATTTVPPPLQHGITVTASLCITAAHCRESMKFSDGPRIISVFGWRKMPHLKEPLHTRQYRHTVRMTRALYAGS